MNSLELLFINDPNLLLEITKEQEGFYFLMKEIVILDLIKEYLFKEENISVTSIDIQDKYFSTILKYEKFVNKKWLERYHPSKPKLKIKQLLINLTTSNAYNSTGLAKRTEITKTKDWAYILSEDFLFYLNKGKESIVHLFYLSNVFPFVSNLCHLIYSNISWNCTYCYRPSEIVLLNVYSPSSDSFLLFSICTECFFKKIDEERQKYVQFIKK